MDPSDAVTVPSVAIVMRTKDRPILLSRAIDDVLSQSFRDWELIIVNDGGDPARVEELVSVREASAAGRIRVIHHHESLGMEAASNAAIRASASEFLAVHDDDDTWDPDFLHLTVDYLNTP
nr:glycosyltransferase [Actinomycetales bacterium]